MIVYHFLNAQYGLEDLRERRLKISRIMELNDPFEFLGVDLSDREFRRALKETKKAMSKTKGILCFSKTWTNPVLWGHYADKHRGLCLGFKIPRVLRKIDYVDFRLRRPSILDEGFTKKLLFTKFSYWQYEQEFRVYLQLEEAIEGVHYAKFSGQLALKRVIVGDQSNVTRTQISEALGSLVNDTEIFKAMAGFRSFKVVRNKNNKMWT
jgi:hypothetical protein